MIKGRAPDVPSKQSDVTSYESFTLTALLYRLNECKTWDLVEEAFVPLGVEWLGRNNSSITKYLHIFYIKDKRKHYLSKSHEVEHLRKKESFVRWNLHKDVFGARFKSNDHSQKFTDALKRNIKETVSIVVRYAGKPIELELLTQKTIVDQLNTFFIAQDLKKDEVLLKYYGTNENVDLSSLLGDLKGSELELVKIVKVSEQTKKESNLTFDIGNPLWKGLVELANLNFEEVSLPASMNIIETFVEDHGGMSYLRQVNGLKMSPQLADELNTLAGQVHATNSSLTNKNTTLERKKRQAPKPPIPNIKESKPFVKRKAPTPPANRAPPQFVPPPPPDDPPPSTSISPVGPLSPKSIDIVCAKKSLNLAVPGEDILTIIEKDLSQMEGEKTDKKLDEWDRREEEFEEKKEEEESVDNHDGFISPVQWEQNKEIVNFDVPETLVLPSPTTRSFKRKEDPNTRDDVKPLSNNACSLNGEDISPCELEEKDKEDVEDGQLILPSLEDILKQKDSKGTDNVVIERDESPLPAEVIEDMLYIKSKEHLINEPEAAEHKEINVNEESVHQQQLRLNESQCQDSTISFKTNLEEKENKQFPSAVEKDKDSPPSQQTELLVEEKKTNNAPRVGLYALLKLRSQQQHQTSNNNHSVQENLKQNSLSKYFQQTSKLKEIESAQNVRQKEEKMKQDEEIKSPDQSPPAPIKKPPPLVKPKPKRPINFTRTTSSSETFSRNVSEENGSHEIVKTKSIGSLSFGFAKDKKLSSEEESFRNKEKIESVGTVKPSQLFKASNIE